MPYEAHYLTPDGDLKHYYSEEEVRNAFDSKQGLLWVDISETTHEDGEFLHHIFNFHHLAIESCVDPRIFPPKVDDFGEYLFITVHGVNHVVESDVVVTAELSLFLGGHFVVSSHNYPLYSVASIKRLVEDDGRPMKRGPDFLAHSLIDAMVDNIMPTLDLMSDRTEEIEEAVIRNPQPSILEAIMQLKRSTQRLRRVMSPQREVLNRLSRGEFKLIAPNAQIFYRDVYDHVVRIEEWNQMFTDRADNALATYLSAISNRQNETMRVLAVVATIFMPLTLVAGIYGMNFEHMPELKVPWAYFAVLGFMGFIAIIAVWFFWARNWIAGGGKQIMKLKPFAVEPEKLVGYVEHFARIDKLTKRRRH